MKLLVLALLAGGIICAPTATADPSTDLWICHELQGGKPAWQVAQELEQNRHITSGPSKQLAWAYVQEVIKTTCPQYLGMTPT